MSSIAWHFEDENLTMGGRERAWMGLLVTKVAEAAIRTLGYEPPPAWNLMGTADLFSRELNTACALGSIPLRLAAHIHGRCETNTLIEGEAFPEVADALREGLETGIFRAETQGYEGIGRIVERLDKGGDWCAWSYSVTDGFPRWDGEKDEFLSDSETIALLRAEPNVLSAGQLASQPTPFDRGETFFTHPPPAEWKR